jgi:hypothetical protein
MARPEVTGRKVADIDTPLAAYTLAEFCKAHRLSESMYYKLKRAGLGPRECKVLSKILITHEAAAEWRAKREAESAA